MQHTSLEPAAIRLLPGLFDKRRSLNRDYLLSLRVDNLLQNFLIEAGIGDQAWHLHPSSADPRDRGLDRHWGWETPGSLLRGHFLGHWMSAAAREIAATGDRALRVALDDVLLGLERCQQENGGEWVFATPRTYLDRLARGLSVWAPQYAIHKTLMGLVDVHRDLGDESALRIADRAADWILRWAASFDDDSFQAILDVETGGMLEVWADLLAITDDAKYTTLLDLYYRRSLFDPLLAGEDVLTNMHANTSIPEILGAARAYEVTGEDKWRTAVLAYWKWAVPRRGTFCTGGQTSGEIWTPPFEFAARRGEKTQEHCTVYNMIRLADVVFRWTGETSCLDYIERNIFNGVLAQQHPRSGAVAYFLPLEGGAQKNWGSATEDFWCCHGTLVQAHTRHSQWAFYAAEDDALVVAQFIPSRAQVTVAAHVLDVQVELLETAMRVGPDANAGQAGARHRPDRWLARVTIRSDDGAAAPVRIRIPEWVAGEVGVQMSEGTSVSLADGFAHVGHRGGDTVVELSLPTALRSIPIPDEPKTVAFASGPVVLAGLVDHEPSLSARGSSPESILVPDNERQWTQWLLRYRTVGQARSIRFLPLHEIEDQRFSVYFPITDAQPAHA